jgi:choline dehydrogenase-like flavoprotein
VRILIFGTGVMGSVYGERLLAARHDVVLLARGGRLRDLRESGLVLQDAQTGHRTALPVTVVAAPEPGDQFDLVLAPVRRDQLPDTIPLLTAVETTRPRTTGRVELHRAGDPGFRLGLADSVSASASDARHLAAAGPFARAVSSRLVSARDWDG